MTVVPSAKSTGKNGKKERLLYVLGTLRKSFSETKRG